MRDYFKEYQGNIRVMDYLLCPLNLGVLQPKATTNLLSRLLRRWPIFFNGGWILFYIYLIFVQRAGLHIVSEQVWCTMTVVQTFSKMLNGIVQEQRVKRLLRWCEENYTTRYKKEYQRIIDKNFEENNRYITMFARLNTLMVFSAYLFYIGQPIFLGHRATPTQISWNGVTYFSIPLWITIYVNQVIHGTCVFLAVSGYDVLVIECVMLMSFRFRVMKKLLSLLGDCREMSGTDQKAILVDIYKMHLDVLETTEVFRGYFNVYGLVQLGTNVFCNCTLLYILQIIGVDIGRLNVLVASCLQVLIACSFGQMLQDQAHSFGAALYSDVDWNNLTLENKKVLLLLQYGTKKKVNIRAGGTFELNLPLFLHVMKTGATICAVMQAM